MGEQIARIEEKDSTLRSLRAELDELLELRAEESLTDEERAAVNGQIKLYVEANLRKVDNVRAFWRYAEDQIASAERDLKDAGARHRSWEAKLEFLKTLCLETMQAFETKRLDGAHGYIRLQGNGGTVPLDIYSAALIPEDLVLYRGWMSAACMAALPPEIVARQDFQFDREPKLGAIKAKLETKCEKCKGSGEARFDERPEDGGTGERAACKMCAGTGHQLVPGARLGARGQHARIR